MRIELELAAQIRRLLESLRNPALAEFLAEWPRTEPSRTSVAASLPVLRWLSEFAPDSTSFGADLIAGLCRAAPLLAWFQAF